MKAFTALLLGLVLAKSSWATTTPADVATTTTAEPIHVVCQPSDINGQVYFVPHPYNCQKFFMCQGYIGILMNCPANLQFDPTLHVCNYPSVVHCENTPRPTPSTTSLAPSTTTTSEETTTVQEETTTAEVETTTTEEETTTTEEETTTTEEETTTTEEETTTTEEETTTTEAETTTTEEETTTMEEETTTIEDETTTVEEDITTVVDEYDDSNDYW